MGDILNALKIGELMTADDLTWQATAILVVRRREGREDLA